MGSSVSRQTITYKEGDEVYNMDPELVEGDTLVPIGIKGRVVGMESMDSDVGFNIGDLVESRVPLDNHNVPAGTPGKVKTVGYDGTIGEVLFKLEGDKTVQLPCDSDDITREPDLIVNFEVGGRYGHTNRVHVNREQISRTKPKVGYVSDFSKKNETKKIVTLKKEKVPKTPATESDGIIKVQRSEFKKMEADDEMKKRRKTRARGFGADKYSYEHFLRKKNSNRRPVGKAATRSNSDTSVRLPNIDGDRTKRSAVNDRVQPMSENRRLAGDEITMGQHAGVGSAITLTVGFLAYMVYRRFAAPRKPEEPSMQMEEP